MALARLQAERKQWRKDHPADFSAKPIENPDGSQDMMRWICQIPGKAGTLWEGGNFTVRLEFSDWRAGISLKEILIGLQDLLQNPNEKDPANGQAAMEYRDNPQQYNKKIREYIKKMNEEKKKTEDDED